MTKILFPLICLIIALSGCTNQAATKAEPSIIWKDKLTQDIFRQAKTEGKLVMLTLEANWCHWCHVMEEKTYSNENVIRYLNDNFISVKLDQDAHPELASRYRKWGWLKLRSFSVQTVMTCSRMPDFLPPSKFIRKLKLVRSGKAEIAQKEEKIKRAPKSTLARFEKSYIRALDLNPWRFYLQE